MNKIEKNKDWISHKATILTPDGEIKDVVIKTICYDEETDEEVKLRKE